MVVTTKIYEYLRKFSKVFKSFQKGKTPEQLFFIDIFGEARTLLRSRWKHPKKRNELTLDLMNHLIVPKLLWDWEHHHRI